MTDINMNLIENARSKTRMLRMRYFRNQYKMIPRTHTNKKKRHHIPPLQQRTRASNYDNYNQNHTNNNNNKQSMPKHVRPRPPRAQLSQLNYKRRVDMRKRRRIALNNNETEKKKEKTKHKTSHKESIKENKNHSHCKSSSLPVIPKLKLKAINTSQNRHQSEPISSRRTHNRQTTSTNRQNHVLPKLQCLKSHRRTARSNITFDKLSQKWFEITFLLRKEINTEESFMDTQKIANESLLFLAQLSETAQKLGILRGTLSRALLPFDLNTSVSDQAHIVSNIDGKKSVLCQMNIHLQKQMQSQAISLRQCLRVKIADDADLDQCKTALLTIQSFCADTLQYCNLNKVTLKDILHQFA
eukprot:836614_1